MAISANSYGEYQEGSNALILLVSNVELSNYEVTFQSSGIKPEINKNINLLCKEASIPTLKTNDADFFIDGIRYQLPKRVQPEASFDLTMYEEENSELRVEFLKWMTKANNITNASATIKFNGIVYTFYNTIPTAVSELKVGAEMDGTIGEYNVTITYDYFDFEPAIKGA